MGSCFRGALAPATTAWQGRGKELRFTPVSSHASAQASSAVTDLSRAQKAWLPLMQPGKATDPQLDGESVLTEVTNAQTTLERHSLGAPCLHAPPPHSLRPFEQQHSHKRLQARTQAPSPSPAQAKPNPGARNPKPNTSPQPNLNPKPRPNLQARSPTLNPQPPAPAPNTQPNQTPSQVSGCGLLWCWVGGLVGGRGGWGAGCCMLGVRLGLGAGCWPACGFAAWAAGWVLGWRWPFLGRRCDILRPDRHDHNRAGLRGQLAAGHTERQPHGQRPQEQHQRENPPQEQGSHARKPSGPAADCRCPVVAGCWLRGCLTASLLGCLLASLPRSLAARLPCLAPWLPGCLAWRLPGCLVAGQPRCLAAWLPCCLAALPGCLVAWPPCLAALLPRCCLAPAAFGRLSIVGYLLPATCCLPPTKNPQQPATSHHQPRAQGPAWPVDTQ